MTFPLLPAPELGLVAAVLIGFGFGFVLERAGFGRAPKLAAQFYGTELTVFKVFFGAVVTAMLGVTVLHVTGLADFKALADHASSTTYLWPMIGGGLLLGAGFLVSGYCPGTSIVAMASGKLDGLATVVGVIAGQVVWAELEWRAPWKAFHDSGDLGNVYLWQLLHLPDRAGPPIVALAIAVMAVGCFLGAEKLERVLGPGPDASSRATPAGRPGRFVFAGFGAAAIVGIAGLALPTGTQAARARAAEPLSPEALARRVFQEPWTVRVIDLRSLAACSSRRVPGAECVPEAELAKLRLADAPAARDLVLVAEGDLAALPPAAAGFPGKLLALRGGWPAWKAWALEPPPPLAADAGPSEREAWRERAGVQAALTGMKAAPPPPPPSAAPAGGPRKGGGGCSG
jgi:sulfur transporter